MLLVASGLFAMFYFASLYLQEILHYKPLKAGLAFLPFTFGIVIGAGASQALIRRIGIRAVTYIGLTLTIIVFSGVAQALATRIGVRPVLTGGMLLSAAALLMYSRLPVDGHYFWDLFPAFILSGLGLALSFVPMSIGALTGVTEDEAGVASGLINTSQQVGGAIGVAVATTVATTFTAHFVNAHAGASALGGAALTHGFEITFYVLAGFAIAGALVAGLLIEGKPRATAEVVVEDVLLEAA